MSARPDPAPVRVAIVGAGAAGLAVARALGAHGVEAVVFEAAPAPGEAWRRRYDRLRLNSVRWLSGQPGLSIPRAAGRWPAASDLVAYLEHYARAHKLRVVASAPVSSIHLDSGGWRLETGQGVWRAERVVIATGYARAPRLPGWWRTEGFDGRLLHSSDYRNPESFVGEDVLVAGCGNSGAEIALDLALGGAARVRLATRTGPTVLPRAMFGLPTHTVAILIAPLPRRAKDAIADLVRRLWYGDLRRLGLPAPTRGVFTRIEEDRVAPVLNSGFVAALAAGRIEIVAAVETLEGREVRLADGAAPTPDAVIAATGFQPGLADLLGPAIPLAANGLPRLSSEFEAVDAPGLYLAGFVVAAGGVLWAIARQSKQIAGSIARGERLDDLPATAQHAAAVR